MSDTPQVPRRSRFWLVASLCLNFFLIGLIVAGLVVARNRMIAGAVRNEGSLPPEVIIQLLPASGATKMCDVVDANTPAFTKLGRDLIEARLEKLATKTVAPVLGNWGAIGNWLLNKGISWGGGKATDAIIDAIQKKLQTAGLLT